MNFPYSVPNVGILPAANTNRLKKQIIRDLSTCGMILSYYKKRTLFLLTNENWACETWHYPRDSKEFPIVTARTISKTRNKWRKEKYWQADYGSSEESINTMDIYTLEIYGKMSPLKVTIESLWISDDTWNRPPSSFLTW